MRSSASLTSERRTWTCGPLTAASIPVSEMSIEPTVRGVLYACKGLNVRMSHSLSVPSIPAVAMYLKECSDDAVTCGQQSCEHVRYAGDLDAAVRVRMPMAVRE